MLDTILISTNQIPLVWLTSQQSSIKLFNVLEMLKLPKMHMKTVLKSNSHQSHYLFLFRVSFEKGKQKTLTKKKCAYNSRNNFKEVQKETHNSKWGFGALRIRNKEPRFLPPRIPPRSESIDEKSTKVSIILIYKILYIKQ